jgi:5'-methylthioadenosine phosphorylase
MNAEIGVIGGSGIYSLLANATEMAVNTKYGKPSDAVAISTIGKSTVAFIPRHGKGHTIPPHKVPYLANLQALKDLGVKRIIATGSLGSLREDYKPGDFVTFDQLVNMTHGRSDTIFDGPEVTHISIADPYCRELRSIVGGASFDTDLNMHKTGTVVVVNGPRFSTKAESRFFASNGIDVINMTQYPEPALAREMGMCYLGIGIITDYDTGLENREDIPPVSFDEILKKFAENVDKLKSLITTVVSLIPKEASCKCQSSLEGAVKM